MAVRGERADDAPGRIAYRVDRSHHRMPAGKHIIEQAFELRSHARIDERRFSPPEHLEQRKASFGRHNVLSLRHQESLPLQPGDYLGTRRRRADSLRFAQALAQRLDLDEAPCVLHRLDERAFPVAGRRPRLLVLDGGLAQPRGFAVGEHGQRDPPAGGRLAV